MHDDPWSDETIRGMYPQDYGLSGPRGRAYRGPVDMKGNPVTRTKSSHPYNYDAFVLHRFRENIEGQGGAYTDRMQGWDPVAWHRAIKAINENGTFSHISPGGWRRFLAAYYPNRQLEIVAVVEECNQSTGYATWAIVFVDHSE